MRQPVRIRRWAAALLALVAPLAQQRPALRDAMPLPAAVTSAAHQVSATNAPESECAEHTSSHHDSPSPHLPWCCELALVPAVTTPWLIPRVGAAAIVAIALPAAYRPAAAHVPPRQTRLPFATAPPSVSA